MSKKDKKQKNGYSCQICGDSPAYWQRAANKYLCTKHASRFLRAVKVLLVIAIIGTFGFVFHNPKLDGPVEMDILRFQGHNVAIVTDSLKNVRMQYIDQLNKKKIRKFIDSNIKKGESITVKSVVYNFLADDYSINVQKTNRVFKVYRLMHKASAYKPIKDHDKFLTAFLKAYNKKNNKNTLFSSL